MLETILIPPCKIASWATHRGTRDFSVAHHQRTPEMIRSPYCPKSQGLTTKHGSSLSITQSANLAVSGTHLHIPEQRDRVNIHGVLVTHLWFSTVLRPELGVVFMK